MADQLLTVAELRAMDLTTELWNVFVLEVVGKEVPLGDVREFAAHLHAIQHAILSQAAARAYPERFRLLGESLKPAAVDHV